jgi:hypothetical protein
MSGRRRDGRARLPPHLRLVEPVDDETPGVIEGSVVIRPVVENIRANAAHVADSVVSWASLECEGIGEGLTSEQAARLRKSAFEIVVELFRTRLVMGLANSCDRMNGVGGWDEHVLPETDTPEGLMARFRAALAEDGEES